MEPNQQNQTSKQNITRDIEIKNNLTVTRGEVGGDKGRGRRIKVFRNNYKGHMDETKGRWKQGGEVGMAGVVGGVVGDKCRQLYLNNNKIISKKKKEKVKTQSTRRQSG